jgi:uncharacterized protein
MQEQINLLMNNLRKMEDFNSVEFVILFGSQSQMSSSELSDYDFVIYYKGNKKQRFDFRMKILGNLSDKFDIKIFQDLPLFVQKDVFKGKVIYSKDISFVYSLAYETLKKFNFFRKEYYDYIGLEKIK